jgi:prefoldin subunit 5
VAFNKFFADICEHYDAKLGFGSKIESLKSEIAALSKEKQEEEKKLDNVKRQIFDMISDKP